MLVDFVTVKGEKVTINALKILYAVLNEKKNIVTIWLDSGDFFDINYEEFIALKSRITSFPFTTHLSKNTNS